jgi:membrane-associated phospholipid phosphatase
VGIVALKSPSTAFRALAAAGVGAALALGLGMLLWRAVERERPQAVYDRVLRSPSDLAGCAESPDALALRSHGSRSPSFPSHHALTAGVFAIALWLAWRPVGAVAWAWALLVCWGRLHAGKHWPTDVLAGLAIGVGIGALCWWVHPRVIGAIRRRGPPAASAPDGDGARR